MTLAKELGVTFPTEAKLIVARRERGADDLLAVKVELSASDWPAFLARSPIDPSLFRPGERGLLGPDDAAWDPNQAKHLRTAETRLSPSRVLNLGYDDSHEGIVMVYLVSHGL